MRMKAFSLVFLWGMMIPLAAQAADAPPALQDFKGAPSAANIKNFQDRIDYWMGQLRGAADEPTVAAARAGLLADYNKVNETDSGAGYPFCEKVAGRVVPVFAKKELEKDALRTVKEINLAMAISQMNQVTIQPALDAMVAYPLNPAVRYLGWKGYRLARTTIYAQGKSFVTAAIAALNKAAKAETSVYVLGAMFNMLTLEENRPSAVRDDPWSAAQEGSFDVLQKNWRPWCQQVRDGSTEMTQAARGAIAADAALASWIAKQDKAVQTRMLQMVVDMAWCAAKAYSDASGNGKVDDSLPAMLRECEACLNKTTQAGKSFLEKPLMDPKTPSNPDQLMWMVDGPNNYGVLAWVEFLKPQGVVKPKIDKTAAAAPASAPAAP